MKIRILLTACLLFMCISGVKAQEWHVSYNYSRFAPLGFSVGYMPENFGGYVSGKFGLASVESGAERHSIDNIVGTSDFEKLGKKRNSYSAGLMVGLGDYIALYGGAGYGTYGEAWGKEGAEEAELVINEFAGPEVELGLMYRGDSWVIGLGGIIMKGTNVTRKAMLVDISVQIGFRF